MFENSGHGWNLPEQLVGSSSRSGCNRGAAVEAVAIREQQTKRTTLGGGGGGGGGGGRVEADAIGEQQLKRTQVMQSGSSSSA